MKKLKWLCDNLGRLTGTMKQAQRWFLQADLHCIEIFRQAGITSGSWRFN